MSLQIIVKNSSVSGKEPTASQLANGELALNYHADGPFITCKDTNGVVRRITGVWIGTTAPDTPQPGELWLDINTNPAVLKVYKDGTDTWVAGTTVSAATTTSAGIVELATNAETQTGSDTTRAVTPAGLQSKLSDSTSTTSSTTIASSSAVKSAYDLANNALPKAGGRVTGALEIGPTGSLVFEGATDDAFELTLTTEDPTADRTITLPNVSGTVVTTGDTGTVTSTMIADGTITNTDINASAAIAHSKLASITAGQVLLGSATNVPTATAFSGDVTVNSSGVTAINSGVIVNADINSAAAIADTKLATISTADKVSLSALNIDGGTDIGTALADADLFIVDDGGAGTNRKAAATRITDYAFGKISGDITTTSAGVTTIKSSVALAGSPTTTTQSAGTNNTTIATTAFVSTAVDAARQGLTVKQACRVATTANITLSGTQTIDGVSVVAGDRVLVKDQTSGATNGIYVCAAGAWSRATDFDADSDLLDAAFTFVEEGTANADSGWVLTTNAPITVGTTALTFAQFSGAGQITAGSGLTKTGNTLDVVGTSGRIVANADSIDLASGVATPGTYPKVTVDTYGRVTAGASLSATDIPSLGNVTNAGAIGSTANLPVITTTSGVLTTGSFGSTANTFCQGNDSRLSDTRNTTNSITFNNGGAGGSSGSTFNGSGALTVSYNTVGAPSTTGTNASGNWGINITGSSASCTGNAATVTNGVYLGNNNALTGANTFTNSTGQIFRQASTQDGILLRGRAGGTGSFNVELVPTTLTASRTLTAPDVSGTVITSGDTGTVTNTMLAGSITNNKLSNSSITVNSASTALGGSVILYAGTTTLQTSSANQGLTGISSIALPGATSGTITVTPAATAGTTAITLPATSGTLITTGDSGTVTSAMIANDSIVNADINASAAIAGTKISPDFGAQNVTTTGTTTAASFIPTSSTVPTNGVYLPAANSVGISTNGLERLRVTTTGLGIGISTPAQPLHIASSSTAIQRLSRTGLADGSASDAAVIEFANGTGAVSEIRARGNGNILLNTRALSTDSYSTKLFINGSTGNLGLGTSSPDALLTVNGIASFGNGAVTTPSIAAFGDLNTGFWFPAADTIAASTGGSERLRVTSTGQLRLAGAGITFNGDTAAANELDDYEEGTFTPTIVGTGTAGTGTYSVQVGRYTKIGQRVYFQINLIWSAHTGTTDMIVGALPFTSANVANAISAVSVRHSNLASPASSVVQGFVASNATTITLESVAVAGGVAAALAMDTAATLTISGHYEAA